MIQEISITIKPENENNNEYILNEIVFSLKKKNIECRRADVTPVFIKKSVDARHGKVKLVMRYKVYIGEKPEEKGSAVPEWKKVQGNKKVIIIGSGPAGLFGALKLLEKGIKPVIIERGNSVSERKRDIAAISTKGIVGEDSNYCFGEGGAGTFSDGKLYTRSNKRGNIDSILAIFNSFGANPAILTDAHPHIGTDKLPAIIASMRDKIIELGGEIYFHTRCIDFIIKNENGAKTIEGIITEDTVTKEKSSIYGDAVLLATGHSAKDIYSLFAKHAPEALEAKTFAVGVRAEHPRQLIDQIQYHGKKSDNLGAAEYRFTTQQQERGVYSFCMCPGGFVVPSATGPGQIVVNGMSSAKRNSLWSNAAIVVETRPEDIPEQFVAEAEKAGSKALAGLLWRTWLENLAGSQGQGQKAPAQRMVDFLENKTSTTLPPTSYPAGVVSSNLRSWIPPQISERLASCFSEVNKSMKGYISEDALLIAIETTTSTPVRIVRNKDTGECIALKNLYPAGEGAGYSGGIVSSAMDGENMCKLITEKLLK